MWEAIERNKRRSLILIAIMGLLLVCFGYVIGAYIYVQFFPLLDAHQTGGTQGLFRTVLQPQSASDSPAAHWSTQLVNSGGFIGAAVALFIWLIQSTVSLLAGDRVLLSAAAAYPIEKEDAPRLWNVVEEMTIAASLGKMPRVCIIDDESPNAFAVGRNPDKAALAVTSGLLKRLNRDELQGVVAHEIGHIRNLDVRFMTLATVMVGSIILISEVFLYYLWFGGGRRSSSRKGGGQAQIVLLAVGLLAAVVAPLAARMLYFACSRRREYLADASAALFTRFPDGLASALEAISTSFVDHRKAARALAPLYIVNPLENRFAIGLFSTHPPTMQRIKILRGMAGRAGFVDYEQAYRKLHGAKAGCIGKRSLGDSESVTARAPTPEPKSKKKQAVERAREVLGVLDRMAGFIPIACACGAMLKLPPAFAHPALRCPRCGRKHEVPAAREHRPAKSQDKSTAEGLSYKRTGKGWESFKCSCGGVIQLSPKVAAAFARCRKCSRHIKIT